MSAPGAHSQAQAQVCTDCFAVYRGEFANCPRSGTPLKALDHDPLLGSTLAGRYVIEEFVGQGAMGRVYKARHHRVSRRFAIKVLFGDLASDKDMRARFAREAEAASRLEHPNVVSVVDFGESETGLLYLAMNYVEGRPLDLIQAEGRMRPERLIALARELCEGLAHAHGRGLVHRDFKPANVIVTREGDHEVPRIVDFGLAVMPETQHLSRITSGRVVFGTPAYMAPEQRYGMNVDARADLYSLGISLYELLTNELPYDTIALMEGRWTPVRFIQDVAPGLILPPGLADVIHRLIAEKAGERYQRATDVIEALDALDAAAIQLERVTAPGPVIMLVPPTPSVQTRLSSVPPPARLPSSRPPDRQPSVPPARQPSSPPDRQASSPSDRHASAPIVLADDDGLRDTQFLPPARRKLWPLLLVGGAAMVGAVLLWFALGLGLGRGRGKSNKASHPVALADPTPDAAVQLAAPVVDAGAAAAREPDAAVVQAPIPPLHPVKPPKQPHEPAGTPHDPKPVPTKPVPTPVPTKPVTAPVPVEITTEALTALYRSVGASLDSLERKRGADVAGPLRKRYFGLPFAAGLRNAALRGDLMKQLATLAHDVKRNLAGH